MSHSNCLIYAVWRWIRRGGWLLMRRSHAGPYPHFAQTDELPEGMQVTHYVRKTVRRNKWQLPCFDGHVKVDFGGTPPRVRGIADWGLVSFIAGCGIGIIAVLVGLIQIIYIVMGAIFT